MRLRRAYEPVATCDPAALSGVIRHHQVPIDRIVSWLEELLLKNCALEFLASQPEHPGHAITNNPAWAEA